MSFKSLVWQHFNKIDSDKAQCLKCESKLSIKGGSTKGLKTHLLTIHKINVDRAKSSQKPPPLSGSNLLNFANINNNSCNTSSKVNSDSIAPPVKKVKINHYFGPEEDNSLECVLARMTAKDGLCFKVFVTSKDLRSSMTARGFNLPNSAVSIKKLVMNYYDGTKTKLCSMLQQNLKDGERFAISLDEWTSMRNRRYLNVNVHTHRHVSYNLGLVRIVASLTSEALLELLNDRLQAFGLDLKKDIVSYTTDGAPSMVKFGKHVSKFSEHQLCYAHAVHLAVCDVVYQNKSVNVKQSDDVSSSNESSDDEDAALDIDSCRHNKIELSKNMKNIIQKIRGVISTICKSPVRNDILQKHVMADFNKELCLLLDVKTRWNSLLTMLERFLKLLSPLRKCLIDLRINVTFSEEEISLCQSIVEALKPVRLLVQTLCAADCTLIIADSAVTFTLNELRSCVDNLFAKTLADSLKSRVTQRQKDDLILTIKYLQNNNLLNSTMQFNLVKYTATIIVRKLELHKQVGENVLSEKHDNSTMPSDLAPMQNAEDTISTCDSTPTDMAQRFKLHLASCLEGDHGRSDRRELDVETIVSKEIEYLCSTNKKGEILQRLFHTLCAIPPTSVEAERAFSACGLFSTKIRSRLDDDTLDKLSFLRKHFQNNCGK